MTVIERFKRTVFDESVLMLNKAGNNRECCYEATPCDAIVFASMGVDGAHYCIVPKEGDSTLESSPIYRVSPMDFSEGTVIWTAKNFSDFISIAAELKRFG